MIYILTNNAYLQYGIQTLLYPLQAKAIEPHAENLDFIHTCNEWDVLVIDTALCLSVIHEIQGCIDRLRVIFLSHSHMSNIAFFDEGMSFHILNCRLARHRFRQVLVNAVAGNTARYDSPILTFTPREEGVFWASMKGFSIVEIARLYAISAQTAYNHRLRACQKLGIRKVSDAFPLLMIFRAYEQKVNAVGKSMQKVVRPCGAMRETDLRSPYLR